MSGTRTPDRSSPQLIPRIGSEPSDDDHKVYRGYQMIPGNTPMSRALASGNPIHFDEQYVDDVTIDWLYKPHTILAATLFIVALIYFVFTNDDSLGQLHNTRVGVAVGIAFFLLLGLLVFPSGPFIRPHPLVWRLAFGIAVLYEMFLIVLLFQTKADARASLTFFYSDLNQELHERSYAADCRLTPSVIWGNIDIFAVSHFLGWAAKSLMLRDVWFCWILSIQWEFMEQIFLPMLPNFAECWWDSWILDVALCNGLGITAGYYLNRYLEVKEYKFTSIKQEATITGKAGRMMQQFTPSSWTKVRWEANSNISRFLGMQALMFAFNLEELNAFMLKHILWIPPPNKLNMYRLIIWAFIGVPAIRQVYRFVTDESCKRIGYQTFLCICILATELLIIVKFSPGEFPEPSTPYTRKLATAVGVVYVTYVAVSLYRIYHRQIQMSIQRKNGVLHSPDHVSNGDASHLWQEDGQSSVLDENGHTQTTIKQMRSPASKPASIAYVDKKST